MIFIYIAASFIIGGITGFGVAVIYYTWFKDSIEFEYKCKEIREQMNDSVMSAGCDCGCDSKKTA